MRFIAESLSWDRLSRALQDSGEQEAPESSYWQETIDGLIGGNHGWLSEETSRLLLYLPSCNPVFHLVFTVNCFYFQCKESSKHSEKWLWVHWPLTICLNLNHIYFYLQHLILLLQQSYTFIKCYLILYWYYNCLLLIWIARRLIMNIVTNTGDIKFDNNTTVGSGES